jgi:phosphoribosyl 1,2-cyclic phosphodiesterase
MLVRFWGTRGSLPKTMQADVARDKVIQALMAAQGRTFKNDSDAAAFVDGELDMPVAGTYGGATSCVELVGGDGDFLVCDMGSGLREFGIDAAKRMADGHAKTFNIFMSHMHWDHIMGFPFFGPSFDSDVKINFYGCHDDLEEALRRQQEEISFPVQFEWLKANIKFNKVVPGETIEVGGYKVRAIKQAHSHDSYGYRFEADGKIAVYSTDSEHKDGDTEGEKAFVAFFRDADLVIFDTMYSLADTMTIKQDWGHSSNVVAVDICRRAGAKRVAMFHHEPIHSDREIFKVHTETIRYEELIRKNVRLEVLCAYDGLEVEL